jgi:hypothetical protein
LPTFFQNGILDSASAETIMNRRELELAAADRCLKARGYIALDEVFREMGKLDAKQWDEWRRGRVPYLERVIRLNLSQINAVCRAVHASARRGNLKPSWTAYVRWGKGPRLPLRFTKSGDPHLERAWATRHVRTQTRSAEVNATATSAIDTYCQVANASGADLDAGFRPASASESGPLPAVP